jgi:hypothetical protein
MAEHSEPTVGDLVELLPGSAQDLIGNGLAMAIRHLQSAAVAFHPSQRDQTLTEWVMSIISAHTISGQVFGVLEQAAPGFGWEALVREARRRIDANDDARQRGEPPPYPGRAGEWQWVSEQPPIPPAFTQD